MRSFALRLSISTPLVLTTLLHLDGLLDGLAIAQGQAPGSIPLAQRDGIWQGSAMMIECGPFGPTYEAATRVKALRPGDVPATLAHHLPRGQRSISSMSPMRPQLTEHDVLVGIKAGWFTGRGDLDTCLELLSHARGIGKLRQTGYGQIDDIQVIDITDNPLTGLLHPNGLAARALPIELWQALKTATAPDIIEAETAVVPPYAFSAKRPGVHPLQIDLTGTHTELARLIEAV